MAVRAYFGQEIHAESPSNGVPTTSLGSFAVAGALDVMALEVKMLINPVLLRDGE